MGEIPDDARAVGAVVQRTFCSEVDQPYVDARPVEPLPTTGYHLHLIAISHALLAQLTFVCIVRHASLIAVVVIDGENVAVVAVAVSVI